MVAHPMTFGAFVNLWPAGFSADCRRVRPSSRISRLTPRPYFHYSRNMETNRESTGAVTALASLAQEHRLMLFRLLVQAGPNGMAAGALADALGIPNSSLSFHLAHLNRAGLIGQRREGRSLIYTANYDAMNRLVGFLTENCCGGADCAPVLSDVEGPAEANPQKKRQSA